MHEILAPIAQVEQDRTARGVEGVRHGLEPLKRDLGRPDPSHVIAAVVFQKVDPPVGKALGILNLMIQGSV
jgi:hypothetical protein